MSRCLSGAQDVLHSHTGTKDVSVADGCSLQLPASLLVSLSLSCIIANVLNFGDAHLCLAVTVQCGALMLVATADAQRVTNKLARADLGPAGASITAIPEAAA